MMICNLGFVAVNHVDDVAAVEPYEQPSAVFVFHDLKESAR